MQPFVCPRCDGEGKITRCEQTMLLEMYRPDLLPKLGDYQKCNPCKGKGVIWREQE